MSRARQKRKELIKNVVASAAIHTQNELIARLAQLGVVTKQAAISRDINDLGITKNEQGIYTLPEDTVVSAPNKFLRTVVSTSDIRVNYVMNQVVVNTPAGAATSIAVYFESIFGEDVLGTIAGHDTILVICKSEAKARKIARKIDKLKK